MNRRGFIGAIVAAIAGRKWFRWQTPPVQAPSLIPFPEIVTCVRQYPGRIDFINLKDWVRIETNPKDYLAFDDVLPKADVIRGQIPLMVEFYKAQICDGTRPS